MEGAKSGMGLLKLNLTVAEVMLLVAGLPIDKTIYYSLDTNIKVIITPEGSLNEMITEENQRKMQESTDVYEDLSDLGNMDASELEDTHE